MADSPADQDLADRYRQYLDACNAHALDRLGEFVAPDIRVDGVPTGLAEYAARIGVVLAAFPDYRWRIRHLIVNRPMLAAHLEDTGTHTGAPFLEVAATGRSVKTTELAVYAFSGGLIAEVWSVSDRLDVLGQLTGDH